MQSVHEPPTLMEVGDYQQQTCGFGFDWPEGSILRSR